MSIHEEKKINDFAHIILDNITEGVFTIDQNHHITSFNRAAESIIGIKSEEAVGMSCYDVSEPVFVNTNARYVIQ